MLADVILGNTITLDRDVPGMLKRLGGRLNWHDVELRIKAPPYLNSTGPLHEDGNGEKYNTVMGFTQTVSDANGTKNPNCPRSKVWILYENRRAYPKYLVRYYRGAYDKSRVMFRTREEAASLGRQPSMAAGVLNPRYAGDQHRGARREGPVHRLVPEGVDDSAAVLPVTSPRRPRRPLPPVRPEVRAAFERYDADGSGTLTKDEAMRLVLGLNLGVSEAYIDGVWTVYDVDGNGVLDVDEFSRLYETMLASNMQHKYPQRNS